MQDDMHLPFDTDLDFEDGFPESEFAGQIVWDGKRLVSEEDFNKQEKVSE